MKISLHLSLLCILSSLILSVAGCGKREVYFQAPPQESLQQLPLDSSLFSRRVALVAEESADNRLRSTAYREVINSISTHPASRDIGLLNTASATGNHAGGIGAAPGASVSTLDLCEADGVNTIVRIRLQMVELRKSNGGSCRITLSLDSSAHDCQGADLGLSIAETGVAGGSSCESALQFVAQDIGDRAARAMAAHFAEGEGSGTEQIVEEDIGLSTGVD